MGNKYYNAIGTTSIADLATALTDKYGDDLTIYYNESGYLIFKCLPISSKVIKVYKNSTSIIQWYYGDAWVSGSSISNQVAFSGSNNGAVSEVHIVLGDSYCMLIELSSSTPYSSVSIIGKLTNDDYIVVGAAGYSGNSQTCIVRNLSTGAEIRPVVMDKTLINDSNYIYKQPLMFAEAVGTMLTNIDGSPATIVGLTNGCYNNTHATLLKGYNFIITPCGLYCNAGSVSLLSTGIMAEF